MFTTGSKLFFGASALALVATLVYVVTTGGPAYMPGVVGLITATLVLAFLAGINFVIRDGNVSGKDDGVGERCAAAQAPRGRTLWPFAAAVGVAGLVVGTVSKPVVFKASLVVVLAAVVEWMVEAWSERASADRAYNSEVRRRLLLPLEFPILSAVVFAVIAYSLSRIMLRLDKDPGKVAFGVIATIVLFAAFLFAGKRNASKQVVGAIVGVFTLVLVGVGVVSAVQGQRPIEAHPTTADESALCLEGGYSEHVDERGTTGVSATSSVVATVRLQSDNTLIAMVNGFQGVPQNSIAVPRGAEVRFVFENRSDAPQRLTARLGTFGSDPEKLVCTTAVEPGDDAFLSVKATRVNAASSTPIELLVPGLAEPQTVPIVVP